jgi:spore coat protein CotF
MFTKYIDILAECSKDVLRKMANIDVANVKIKQKNFYQQLIQLPILYNMKILIIK